MTIKKEKRIDVTPKYPTHPTVLGLGLGLRLGIGLRITDWELWLGVSIIRDSG